MKNKTQLGSTSRVTRKIDRIRQLVGWAAKRTGPWKTRSKAIWIARAKRASAELLNSGVHLEPAETEFLVRVLDEARYESNRHMVIPQFVRMPDGCWKEVEDLDTRDVDPGDPRSGWQRLLSELGVRVPLDSITEDVSERLKAVIRRLPQLQREILRRRFGLGRYTVWTIHQCAIGLEKSSNEIRIETRNALLRLGTPRFMEMVKVGIKSSKG